MNVKAQNYYEAYLGLTWIEMKAVHVFMSVIAVLVAVAASRHWSLANSAIIVSKQNLIRFNL